MAMHGRRGHHFAARRHVALLALAGAVALSAAAAAAADGKPRDAAFCLQVQGKVADGATPLRLAAPPLDLLKGSNPMSSILSRLMGESAMRGAASAAAASSSPSLASTWFAAAEPSTKRLFDGSADLLAGRHAAAQHQLIECAQLAAKQGDSLTEAACANNLGVAHAGQGRHAQARAEFERALRLYETPRTPPADLKLPPAMQAMTLAIMPPAVLQRLPPAQRAEMEARMAAGSKDAALTAWRDSERRNSLTGIELATLNLGNLALATGRLADAQALLQRALDNHPADDPPQCRAAAALDLARLHRRLNRTAESQALVDRYPARPRREGKGEADGDMGIAELGAISLAPSTGDAVSAGTAAPREPTAAAANPGTSIPFSLNESAGRLGDTSLAELLAQASRETSTRVPAQAIAAWQRLALRAEAAQRADLGFSAHATLMRLHGAQGDAAAAIYHGKRAAQLAQTTRAELADSSPSRDARRAFLRERRGVYVGLAQVLLDQQRLAEAEAALQLLKEDEGQQFVGGAVASLGRVPLGGAEQARRRQDEDAARQLREADQARVAAANIVPIGSGILLMASPAQIEAFRLKQGLTLPGLAAQLKRTPLRAPGGNDSMAPAMLRDLQDFLLGPQRRLERFLTHLIEDGSRFDPPVSAQDRAQLTDTLKRLPQIQAELAPLVRELRPSPGFTTTVRPAGSPREDTDQVAWNLVFTAEPLERVWRNLQSSNDIEERHLRRTTGAEARASLAAAAPSSAAVPDDTLTLLAAQPVATALLYYLPGDERLDVLLVGAGGRRHWRLAQPRAELERSVDEFVKLLRRSERDPRPAARAMYERLFAPVAQALADSGARVVALSLADSLRFVPFAALHDGRGWLVERYALALHPGGPLAGRLRPASPNWRAAAFGASIGGGEFAPLLNVRSEIAGIVRQDGAAAGGVLPGEAWLDQAFTAQRLRAALGSGANVLHIASHFKFVGGDAAASYLLLGDGGKLSLRELAGPEYRFDRTELVTLSACTTGRSADDTFGQEVDGLAALLMGQGAPSVLASLWDVNDKSTATLMASLYRLRESGRLSRALALQQAQLAMIRAAGPGTGGGELDTRGVSRVRLPGDPEPAPADGASGSPAALGNGHPFHWAPFVLMGNWL